LGRRGGRTRNLIPKPKKKETLQPQQALRMTKKKKGTIPGGGGNQYCNWEEKHHLEQGQRLRRERGKNGRFNAKYSTKKYPINLVKKKGGRKIPIGERVGRNIIVALKSSHLYVLKRRKEK